jgi:hypothetical protein
MREFEVLPVPAYEKRIDIRSPFVWETPKFIAALLWVFEPKFGAKKLAMAGLFEVVA